MRSPHFNAMARRKAAGSPSSESSVAIPGGDRAPTRSPECQGQDFRERQPQHAPRHRAERPGADRLEPPVRQILPDRRAADPAGRERQGAAGRRSRRPIPPPTRRRRSAPRDVVLAETPRVRIETPRLQGSINLKGARFDDLVLVRERETHRQEFAAGPPAFAGRRQGQLFRPVRLGRPGRRRARRQQRLDRQRAGADARASRSRSAGPTRPASGSS